MPWKIKIKFLIKKMCQPSLSVVNLKPALLKDLDFKKVTTVKKCIIIYDWTIWTKTPGEKAQWELHKNAVFCFEQILETVPDKIAAVRPFTSYLKNHPNKTSWALLEK